MQTTPLNSPPKPPNPPVKPVGFFSRGQLAAVLAALVLVALLAFGSQAWESFAGGPVRSTAQFGEHVMATRQAGEDVYDQLSPMPLNQAYAEKEGSTSCVDDLGFDGTGVTRDEPIYTWELDFASRRDYLAAVVHLKAGWSEEGRTVKDIPAPAEGERGHGLPGVSTTDEHGTELALRPDYFTGEPVIRAEGTCMRYHDEYGYDYDEDGEAGW
ncbi:hypothetical protein AB0D78_21965 [Streptomyces avermitilis]|uniref:hypothetical protein n=1 Tax=Streptomyces avermitilis TaxID=33903 RepID=UPI0033D6C32B